MSLRVVLLPEAEEDIDEAAKWYEEQRPGLGLEFIAVVDTFLRRLAKSHLVHAAWSSAPRYRRAVLHRFPYVVFYEVRADTVEVAACAHARRMPGYWRTRTATESTSPWR